tara:strand:- start:4719 stop:6755 length:2037 start_codon:yes stop_codon:yes gene_type:complete
MSSPTVQMPAPVDAVGVANQQGQNNLEAAIATSLLNQTNEVTPYGTVSYTQNQNPAMRRSFNNNTPQGAAPQINQAQNNPPQYQEPQGSEKDYGSGSPMTYNPLQPNEQYTDGQISGGSQTPLGRSPLGNIDIPSFTRTVTLSDAQQQKLQDQDYIQGQTANIARDQLGRVREGLSQEIDYSAVPDMVSNISGGQIQGFNPNAGQVQGQLRQFDPLGGINNRNLQGAGVQGTQGNINQAGLFGIDPQAVQGQLEGDLQGVTVNQAQGINTGGLQDVRDDYSLQGNELERATFERGRSLLEPQFGRAMRDAEVRLSERGLPLSSEAGSEILGGVQTNQNRALNELALSSVAAGRGEQARLFGQDMALRGQQFGERSTGTQLGNQAIGQNFSQDTGLRGQQFGEQQARASLFNEAGQQQFGQNTAARQQLVNERMGQAALANQANQQRFAQQTGLRGQQFGERQAEADFANQARGQAFTQGAAGAEFANNAQAQRFAQSQQANILNNQLQQQAYTQAAGNAQLQNTSRQNALQEQIFNRNIPLNDLAALMGQSGGVQLPQFAASPNVAVQSGDLVGASLAANQQAIDVAKAKQAASGGFMGGLMELGGALGGAAISKYSDVRLKENIKRIGKYKNHNLYEYNYIWSKVKELGVMAQEIEKVIPNAVKELNGFKTVNYEAI